MTLDELLDTIDIVGPQRQQQPALVVHFDPAAETPRAIRVVRCCRVTEAFPDRTTRSVSDNEHHADDYVLLASPDAAEGMTWGEVTAAMSHIDAQRGEREAQVAILPAGEGVVELMATVEIDTVRHLYGDDVVPVLAGEALRNDQMVLMTDCNPFDEEGNMSFELTDEGLVGDRTGKLYEI